MKRATRKPRGTRRRVSGDVKTGEDLSITKLLTSSALVLSVPRSSHDAARAQLTTLVGDSPGAEEQRDLQHFFSFFLLRNLLLVGLSREADLNTRGACEKLIGTRVVGKEETEWRQFQQRRDRGFDLRVMGATARQIPLPELVQGLRKFYPISDVSWLEPRLEVAGSGGTIFVRCDDEGTARRARQLLCPGPIGGYWIHSVAANPKSGKGAAKGSASAVAKEMGSGEARLEIRNLEVQVGDLTDKIAHLLKVVEKLEQQPRKETRPVAECPEGTLSGTTLPCPKVFEQVPSGGEEEDGPEEDEEDDGGSSPLPPTNRKRDGGTDRTHVSPEKKKMPREPASTRETARQQGFIPGFFKRAEQPLNGSSGDAGRKGDEL